MPTYYLVVSVTLAILAVFQGISILGSVSILLTNTEPSANRIQGTSTWLAGEGAMSEEFTDVELESSEVMAHDFKELIPAP